VNCRLPYFTTLTLKTEIRPFIGRTRALWARRSLDETPIIGYYSFQGGGQFSIEEKVMSSWGSAYTRCYTFRGEGDISAATAVQARLREHGVCSYFNWDPRPPRWRFFYETNLSRVEVERILDTMLERFKVVIEI
jgi:hypothetical protein